MLLYEQMKNFTNKNKCSEKNKNINYGNHRHIDRDY